MHSTVRGGGTSPHTHCTSYCTSVHILHAHRLTQCPQAQTTNQHTPCIAATCCTRTHMRTRKRARTHTHTRWKPQTTKWQRGTTKNSLQTALSAFHSVVKTGVWLTDRQTERWTDWLPTSGTWQPPMPPKSLGMLHTPFVGIKKLPNEEPVLEATNPPRATTHTQLGMGVCMGKGKEDREREAGCCLQTVSA